MTTLFISRRRHDLPVLRVRVVRRRVWAAKAARNMARAGYPPWAIRKILGLPARRLADCLHGGLWTAAQTNLFRSLA